MDPKYWLVLAVILIMGWFVFGVLYNLRTGDALLRWLQKGLPRVGEKTTFRWLGTSVVELGIQRAKKPFRSLDTLIVLAPRDVPWFWLLSAAQGRRDTLIFRAHLYTPPHVDLELADPSSWTGRLALQQAVQKGWEGQPFQGDLGVQLMAPAGLRGLAASTLADLAVPMQRMALHYFRFSLRKEAPHLEIHVAFPDRRSDAEQFIASLQELAQAIGASS